MKVLLLLGHDLEDIQFLVVESSKADKFIPDWGSACEVVFEHPNVFKEFTSVVDAVKYCIDNGYEIEEEVTFTCY